MNAQREMIRAVIMRTAQTRSEVMHAVVIVVTKMTLEPDV